MTGAAAEGVWVSASGPAAGIAFIDATNTYLGTKDGFLLLDGTWLLAGSSWAFDATTSRLANTSGGVPIVAELVGWGTLNTRTNFLGAFGFFSPSLPIANDYSNANALAVSQSSISGKWASSNVSIEISATGVATGRWTATAVGDCLLTGTVLQATTGSAKNLFSVSVTTTAGPNGACNLRSGGSYTGFAAVTFTNVGGATTPSYVRSLTFLVRNNASWFSGELPKS